MGLPHLSRKTVSYLLHFIQPDQDSGFALRNSDLSLRFFLNECNSLTLTYSIRSGYGGRKRRWDVAGNQ